MSEQLYLKGVRAINYSVIYMVKPMLMGGEHKTKWVTISLDEYDSMRRTIEVLSDKDLLRQIIKSESDIKAGRVSKWKDFMKESKAK